GFPRLSPTLGQVSHVLLTRSPLYSRSCPRFLVRLACVRHAASVDSEPGSNSRLKPDVSSDGQSSHLIKPYCACWDSPTVKMTATRIKRRIGFSHPGLKPWAF